MDNWCFIIPYRDREEHLKRFISHYGGLFHGVPIIVVEQQPNTPFNRAKLLNVGFLEEGRNYTWAAYHDVDMYVFTEYSNCYTHPENPTHLATRCEQFNYTLPYKEYTGGVLLINTNQMVSLNGFSNNYWGYGCEDDDMRKNIDKKFPLNSVECYYNCPQHERNIDNKLYPKNLRLLKQGRILFDGLGTCHYVVTSREEKEGYTLIKVNI